MATKQTNQETAQCSCPVCRLFTELESAYGKKSNFFNHLNNSRVELLKAVKALVDDRIEYLEKRPKRRPRGRRLRSRSSNFLLPQAAG